MLKRIHPGKIRLEASTLCQLRCPCCSTAQRKIEAVLGSLFSLRSKNPDFVKRESGLAVSDCEEDWKMQGGEYGASFCRMLWEEPQINWDGKILGCCCNYWKAFPGNAFNRRVC